jgi:hypothetical protein
MEKIETGFALRSRVLFIDSSVYHSNNYQFFTKDLESLTRLLNSDQVTLLFTSITVSEIRRHLKIQSKEAASAAQSFQQKGKILRNLPLFSKSIMFDSVMSKDVEEELLAGFETFTSSKNVEVISVNLASAENVFDRYFSMLPPFSEKKPDEFRDAFVLEALKAYAIENDVRVHVISSDHDMRDYCAGDPWLFWSSNLGEVVNMLAHSVREEPLVFADKAYTLVKALFAQIVDDFLGMQDFGIVSSPEEKVYDFRFVVENIRATNERVFSASKKDSFHGVNFEFDVVVKYCKSGEYLGFLSDRDVDPTYQKEEYSQRYSKKLEAEVVLSFFEGDLESVILEDWNFDLVDGDILEYPYMESVTRPRMFPTYEN